ncbi:MAG: methyltransferase domain-containing protein [Rhodocyclaceae bacterium]|nr:methyltransferase domain-containing protein [Rhodocyclaceae bacterium]
MSSWRDWVAHAAQAWLQRFRQRHGLTAAAPTPGTGQKASLDGKRVLLHVGCGYATIEQIPVPGFRRPELEWHEIRLDADARVLPDIVGTMTDMAAVPDAFADAIFSSHGVEHLYWHDVPRALTEFRRVLADDGFAVITCPDLQAAAQMIAEDRLFETAYVSQAGPITPFDIVYSYRPFVEENPEWMSHHCGFTLSTLTAAMRAAGFESIHGVRRAPGFDLWVLASKSRRTADEMAVLAGDYSLPGC